MNIRFFLSAAVLTVLAAVAVFTLKYEVLALEDERAAIDQAIAQEHWQLQLARVELDYLRRPQRLKAQAEQLGMIQGSADQIIEPSMIGRVEEMRIAEQPLLVNLPSGASVQLLARPAHAWALAPENPGTAAALKVSHQ